MNKEFPELRKQNHYRRDWSHQADVHGFDTETYKGTANLICSDCEYIEPCCIDEVLTFLNQHKYRSTYNFYFNIKFDFGAMLKWLGFDEPDLFRELIMENETQYKDYQLYYIPSKLFQIRKQKGKDKKRWNKIEYFDLTNFFTGKLADNMKQYLNIEKIDTIDAHRLNIDHKYYANNREEVIEYCLRDAEGAKGLGELLQNAYQQSLGIYPKSYLSKAFVSANYFRQECYIPSINKLDPKMLRYWWEQYKGGRFEVYHKGFFPHVYDYDLTSAYPATIAQLLNIKVGDWRETEEMHKEADYGVYRCDVNVHDVNVPPIGIHEYNKVIFPVGYIGEVYLTKDELIAFDEDIDYQIKDGWEFSTSKKIFPFLDKIEELVKLKTEIKGKYGKDSMEYALIKITLNSFYGKFLQDNNGVIGKYWNIVYGALVTTDTKIKVWKLAKKAGDGLISIETDGIFCEDKLGIEVGNKIGQWELDEADDMFIIGNGVFTNSSKLRSRGFPKKYLDFDMIMEKYGDKQTFEFVQEKPVTLKEALIQKKYTFEDVNVWNKTKKKINCNSDVKRVWQRYDYSFNDLRNKGAISSPLIMETKG